MLLEREKSRLILVDVQEKLTPHVMNADLLVARCQWMLGLAAELNVPITISEQYPSGLKGTVNPLQSFVNKDNLFDKIHFSCYRASSLLESIQKQPQSQLVLIGIETHVCVLQTAIDFQAAGWEVFVVVDAVSSRHALDHKIALKRMQQLGIQLVTSEMVLFEWLEKAATDEFRLISKNYLRG